MQKIKIPFTEGEIGRRTPTVVVADTKVELFARIMPENTTGQFSPVEKREKSNRPEPGLVNRPLRWTKRRRRLRCGPAMAAGKYLPGQST